jgi:hypothetical protein
VSFNGVTGGLRLRPATQQRDPYVEAAKAANADANTQRQQPQQFNDDIPF